MLRQEISQALTTAMKAHEKMRASTLRLIMAALKDRDIANRGAGKDPVSDDEILAILAKMIKQREESAKMYEEGNRIELAENERAEIEIIREFLPQQLSDEEIRANSAAAIAEIGAEGLRDMGKVMAVLKERYTGQMDFAKASGVLKELLGS
ncbi:MAG: GatB/YqeY domain-containing protein [Brucellaceae bacterium]|nr:GatB/YqeY domain-containing protein [Brucellaceae bacterium]